MLILSIILLIVINIIVLAVVHYVQSDDKANFVNELMSSIQNPLSSTGK